LGVGKGADISSPYEVNLCGKLFKRLGQSLWNDLSSRHMWSELYTGLGGEA